MLHIKKKYISQHVKPPLPNSAYAITLAPPRCLVEPYLGPCLTSAAMLDLYHALGFATTYSRAHHHYHQLSLFTARHYLSLHYIWIRN